MKKWIKHKILEWLTAPDKKPIKQEEKIDVKFTNDPVPEGFIPITDLTDTIFNEHVVMFNLGKDQEGKWYYYARSKFKRENNFN